MNREPGVTAVVLSIGEPTTARAVESVRRQTLVIRDIVLVEGVTPFHRALNEGAARVTTPFFVQVDADMILDADCVEGLAACLAENVGVVVGHLRDPLWGRVQAIKLFRTECVRRQRFPDSISPDTDFVATIGRHGWTTIYALRYHDRRGPEWHTFGEHSPAYTPLYTYAKLVLEGRRLRYHQDPVALRYHLELLQASTHPASLIAEIALAHGLFLAGDTDLLTRYREDSDFRRLTDFLDGRGQQGGGGLAARPWSALFPKAAFRRCYKLGISVARARDAGRFERVLRHLHASRHPWSWLMQIGLCHGLFAERYAPAVFEEEWAKLQAFRSDLGAAALARHLTRELRARAAVRRLARDAATSSLSRR